MNVTVAVPAYGDPGPLARLLAALDAHARAAGVRLPVVVADDASPNPLAASLPVTPALDVRVVRSPVNGGPGAARNRALAVVTTPWVAFLDADEVPGDGWLTRLLALVADPATADAVEGRVVGSAERATPFTHAGEFAERATEPMGLGGNNLYRVQVLRRVGGFDERFYDRRRRIHFREDTDLWFRLLDDGATVAHDPSWVVHHPPQPPSVLTPVREARRYGFDPLLSRRHPERFRRLVRSRRVGPVPLRRARHDAAMLLAAGVVATAGGAVVRRPAVVRLGATVTATAWAANVAAVTWRRTVRVGDWPAVAVLGFATPAAYLWSYWRGVVRWRHRPRL